MTFGTPAFFARGIASMMPLTIESWFAGSFRPLGMPSSDSCSRPSNMQAMVGENAPVFLVHQIDGGETHLHHRLAELGERYLL